MILDTIVEQKKIEVDALLSKGIIAPDCSIDPPRGFKKALLDYPCLLIVIPH